MSQHNASVIWKLQAESFDYQTYNRDHRWVFDHGLEVEASAASQFLGNPKCVDPEEGFVAALASCHMLTFLAICAREGIGVDLYEDKAVGYLERNENNDLVMARVTLKPRIRFFESEPDAQTLGILHHKAHRECFLAKSVTTQITVESDK